MRWQCNRASKIDHNVKQNIMTCVQFTLKETKEEKQTHHGAKATKTRKGKIVLKVVK